MLCHFDVTWQWGMYRSPQDGQGMLEHLHDKRRTPWCPPNIPRMFAHTHFPTASWQRLGGKKVVMGSEGMSPTWEEGLGGVQSLCYTSLKWILKAFKLHMCKRLGEDVSTLFLSKFGVWWCFVEHFLVWSDSQLQYAWCYIPNFWPNFKIVPNRWI